MTTHPSPQRSVTWRSCEVLRVAERQAVEFRKRLKELEQLEGRQLRGVMDDAVKLTETIEQLARYGQVCSAADAAEIEFHIEILISVLRGEFDQFFAS